MLILAVDRLSNGKFSSAVIKMLNYCHEIKQRYHDAKWGDNSYLPVFSLICKNNFPFGEWK